MTDILSSPAEVSFTNNGELATNAQSTANTALSNATRANSDLSQAKEDLQSNIDQAKTDISSAKSDITQAKTDISSANSDIAQAKTDIANNKTGLSTLKQTTEENSSAIANNKSDISLVKQTATQNSTDIANAKGDISTLKQTAKENSSAIETANGNISSLQQTSDKNSSAISEANGNISSLQQTATKNTSAISEANGHISTLQQTTDKNSSAISDANGHISTLQQTADKNSSAIEKANGNISSLQQTADKNTSAISDANGNISSLQQTSDKISSTVANSGATNLVYNSEYDNSGDGWNTFGAGYLSSTPSDMYNGSQGFGVNVSGKGANTWTQFGESKRVAVPTTTVDSANAFSFSAMVKIYAHSQEAATVLSLGFFDSSGTRIAFQNVGADSNKADWQKVTFDGYAYPTGAVTMAIQYTVYGDTMNAVVAQPIITQTSTNVPYHADTANQATVVKQTADQWSTFASKNGIFTGITVNSDGTINMDGAKVKVSGDMIVGGTLSSNSVSINGSTDKVDQLNQGVYHPWNWGKSSFTLANSFINMNVVDTGKYGSPYRDAINSANYYIALMFNATIAPTYIKYTSWNSTNFTNEKDRFYADPQMIEIGNLTLAANTIYNRNQNDIYFTQGNISTSYSGHAATIHASVVNSSTLSVKTDLQKMDEQDAINAIKNIDEYSYQYKSDANNGSKQRYVSGIIDDVNDTPQYKMDPLFIYEGGQDRVDSNLLNVQTVVIQNLLRRVEKLESLTTVQQ